MIRTIGVATATLMISATSWAAPPKLLVEDFRAKGVAPHEASVISNAACIAFSKTPKYEVLCGDDLRNLMQFGSLAASFDSCDNDDCYAAMGEALKARFLVSGSVSKLGSSFVLDVTLLDTKGDTKRTVAKTQIKAPTLEQLHQDTPEAVSAVLQPKKSKR